VSVGAIAIDWTKVEANASMDANRPYRQIVTQILRRPTTSTATGIFM
jgi:hypothetical protein